MPAPALPHFIPPMLAAIGRPFDSDEHLFEVKWDGTRCLAFVEDGGVRLRNRKDRDLVPNYPELQSLAALPPGLVLDGEIVVLDGGRSDFSLVMQRDHARGAARIAQLARSIPVNYMAFDLLYLGYRPLLDRPLAERRALLEELVRSAAPPRVLLSEGIVAGGLRFFEECVARGLEGAIAKRLDSRYLPGKRTDAWQKLKPALTLHCAIIGYMPDEHAGRAGRAKDFKSLIVAAETDGRLVSVGRVGSGLTAPLRRELLPLLDARRRATALVPCAEKGVWVEPGLYCLISCVERTKAGSLRAPVFIRMITEGA